MSEPKPLCFVLMPFGTKPDPAGGAPIEFNRIYSEAIEPAISAAGLLPIRADQEKSGGIVHKAMLERLLLCEYAVADLTTANANVFYELGVRHAARPRTTQAIFASHQPIPFDVAPLRALPYELGPHNAFGPDEATALRESLSKRMLELRDGAVRDAAIADSPLFQLLGSWRPGSLAREKTDVFRQQVEINEHYRERIARARESGRDGIPALLAVQAELGRLDLDEAGVIIDLYLSLRALKAWNEMIALNEAMPDALRRQILVREQLAFALNRRASSDDAQPGDRDMALRLLQAVEDEQGPSAETCGLIGRIYKDLWDAAKAAGSRDARGYLKRAIEAYVRGFQADSRDAYPGINAVTLLEVKGDKAALAERDRLVPVVLYAVERRLEGKEPDYWDHATMVELAVLQSDEDGANDHLDNALAAVRESWEPETTARNLRLIAEVRRHRNEDADWIDGLVDALVEKQRGMEKARAG